MHALCKAFMCFCILTPFKQAPHGLCNQSDGFPSPRCIGENAHWNVWTLKRWGCARWPPQPLKLQRWGENLCILRVSSGTEKWMDTLEMSYSVWQDLFSLLLSRWCLPDMFQRSPLSSHGVGGSCLFCVWQAGFLQNTARQRHLFVFVSGINSH